MSIEIFGCIAFGIFIIFSLWRRGRMRRKDNSELNTIFKIDSSNHYHSHNNIMVK